MNTSNLFYWTPEALSELLKQALQPSYLEVMDESHHHQGHVGSNQHGKGSHFRVRIQGGDLSGLGRVQAHRAIYEALAKPLEQGVHALAIEVLPVTKPTNISAV